MKNREILRQILDSCDENLLDVFLRRMEISVKGAQDYLEHPDGAIYQPEEEEHILQHVTNGLSPELTTYAHALWSSLLRMSRSRQYRYLITHDASITLAHEHDMTREMSDSGVLCPETMCREVSSALNMEVLPRHSVAAVIDGLLNGEAEHAAVMASSYYETEWIYSMIYDQPIYINALVPAAEGHMVVLLSKKLVDLPDKSIISVAFAIRMSQKGHLASTLSILSDAGLKVEYFRVKTEDIDKDDEQQINYVFAELRGRLTSTETRTALLQMEQEMPFFRVIGYRVSVLD